MKPLFIFSIISVLFIFFTPQVFATNCIESMTCLPVKPTDVLNLYDVWFGTGMSVVVMALIMGIITIAIYVRTRNLPMLAILGLYEIAAFGSILTSKYISSQYQMMPYVIGIAGAVAGTFMILRLVKE